MSRREDGLHAHLGAHRAHRVRRPFPLVLLRTLGKWQIRGTTNYFAYTLILSRRTKSVGRASHPNQSAQLASSRGRVLTRDNAAPTKKSNLHLRYYTRIIQRQDLSIPSKLRLVAQPTSKSGIHRHFAIIFLRRSHIAENDSYK